LFQGRLQPGAFSVGGAFSDFISVCKRKLFQ
jgi:hypothetical protein